ncbi:MOS1T transposase, partial [Pseudoatta argentina]
VYGDTAPTDKSCTEWFRCFKDGDFSVEDKPRSGQPKIFEDKELEELLEEDQIKMRKHGDMLPASIRAIVCGSSNCDKTNMLINLLESPHGPKYRYLANLLVPIEKIDYFTFSNNSDVIPPSEALPNSIFIFDDIACDKQDTIREYFAMGRHVDVDCFYFCQTYAKIPKHLIHDNANLLILFEQNGTNLKHIYNDHVNTDMSYEDFCNLCCKSWRQKYGFLVIDKDNALTDGLYRKEFNDFAIL